jgi:hypothetical protein
MEDQRKGKWKTEKEHYQRRNWRLDMVQCCDMSGCLIDWTFTNLSAVSSS